MRRDELSKPLHKRSFGQRLWARRPSLLPLAYTLVIASFATGTLWLSKQPLPFAGEPIVVVALPPVEEEIKTASVDPAPPPIEVVDVAPEPVKPQAKAQA